MAEKYNLDWRLRLMDWLMKRTLHWDEASLEQNRKQRSDFSSRGFSRKVALHQIEDRQISGRHGDIPLRIYRPTADNSLRLIVFYHGGGWTIGNLDSYDHICRRIARDCEAVVVSVDYRLAPEHKFPVAVEEAYDALCWAAKNSSELGTDPNKLFVMGDSAGGNISAVMTLMARDKTEPKIAGQVLIYPAVDKSRDYPSRLDFHDAPVLDKAAMDFFLAMYSRSEDDWTHPYFSPMCAESHADLPPALIQVAEYDPLRDEGLAYAETLRESGVQAEAIAYPRMVHGFYSFGAFAKESHRAYVDIAEFVHSLR